MRAGENFHQKMENVFVRLMEMLAECFQVFLGLTPEAGVFLHLCG